MTAIPPSPTATPEPAVYAGAKEVANKYTTVAKLEEPARKISSTASNSTGKPSSYGPQNQGDFSAIA